MEVNADLELLKSLMDKPITTVLTLRDHFALAALGALLRGSPAYRDMEFDDMAGVAYGHADAMLKAREAKSST